MRLLRFYYNDPRSPAESRPAEIGVVADGGEGIVAIQRHELRAPSGQPITTISEALHPQAIDAVRALAQREPDLAWEQITYAAPVDIGSKLLCAGANFHKKYPLGGDIQEPTQPVYFNKPPGVLAAHGEPLLVPTASPQLDYEVEMAVVIGKSGRHIELSDALSHVAGYTIMNDGSVRNWQRHSVAAGKNFFRAGSLGPWITSADEITQPTAMRISCRINGQERQNACVDEMIFSVSELITYLSKILPLAPGDVISTGSPEGTGGSHDPPQWLKPGDKVECELTGVGVLSNDVIAE